MEYCLQPSLPLHSSTDCHQQTFQKHCSYLLEVTFGRVAYNLGTILELNLRQQIFLPFSLFIPQNTTHMRSLLM